MSKAIQVEQPLSKELARELSGGYEIEDVYESDDEFVLEHKGGANEVHNIYKVALWCKDKAFEKGFYIASWKDREGYYCEVSNFNNEFLKDLTVDSGEHDAIIEAYEWILEEMKS